MEPILTSALGLIATLWGGGPADFDATPKDLLVAVYAHHPTLETSLTPDDVYSDRLQTLFTDYFRESEKIVLAAASDAPPINLIPFDPLSLVASSGNVSISEPVITARQATATVNIRGAADPTQLSLFMVEEDDGWRIDDIASFDSGGQPWLLSWILRYDPPMDG